MLEGAKINLLDQLWSNSGLCKSESKNFAHTLSKLSLQNIPIAVDDGGESFECVLFNLNIIWLSQLVQIFSQKLECNNVLKLWASKFNSSSGGRDLQVLAWLECCINDIKHLIREVSQKAA